MELNFKIICLETKNYTYLTDEEFKRIVNMASKWNIGIHRKIKPFYKEQCYILENGKEDSDGI